MSSACALYGHGVGEREESPEQTKQKQTCWRLLHPAIASSKIPRKYPVNIYSDHVTVRNESGLTEEQGWFYAMEYSARRLPPPSSL